MSDFEKSNSNIFADLGDPEAEQTLVRARNSRNFRNIKTRSISINQGKTESIFS